MKNTLFIATLLLLMHSSQMQGQKPENTTEMKIIYAFDPLCGWCYGFSKSFEEFIAQHPDLDVEILCGGMVTGDRVGPLSDIAPYLRTAYKDVESRTGVKFGEVYLAELFGDAGMIMNSIPPSRALVAFKMLNTDARAAVRFGSAIQHAIYFNGLAPEDEVGWVALAVEFGLDGAAFQQTLQSEQCSINLENEFIRVQQMGVKGFPTVALSTEKQLHILSRGYVNSNSLSQQFEQITQP
jgi:putative protein-disulfide isomerase